MKKTEATKIADRLREVASAANDGLNWPRAAVVECIRKNDAIVPIDEIGRIVQKANERRVAFNWPITALLESLEPPTKPAARDVSVTPKPAEADAEAATEGDEVEEPEEEPGKKGR